MGNLVDLAENAVNRAVKSVTNMDDNVASELGMRLDGCCEVFDGMGSKSQAFNQAFTEIVSARELAFVKLGWRMLSTGGTPQGNLLKAGLALLTIPSLAAYYITRKGAERPYYILKAPSGASVGVFIGQFGQDLFVSWGLHTRLKVHWPVAITTLGLSFLAGVVDPGGFIGFYGWFIASVLWWTFASVIAGLIIKGHPLGYLCHQWTTFDKDDASAMAMITHRCLLQAADQVGIDVKILRLKEQFYNGRRDRVI